MTSIDDLFRGRAAPTSNPSTSSNKRKLDLPSARDPSELYKASKTNGKSPRATSRDLPDRADELEDDDGIEAGPALPGADDEGQEEEEDPDDEEGRFFGSGVGTQTRDALQYLDDDDPADGGVPLAAEKLDGAWLQRKVQSLSSRISKNAEQRAKFESRPEQFMESEAALDDEVRALSLLSEVPELYSQFAKLGGVENLVGLLAHDNTDIAIRVVQVLSELTDEDLSVDATQWEAFVTAALEADVIGLLTGNLSRLDEDGDNAEGDRNGVYHTLSLVENMASQAAAAVAVIEEGTLLPWLLQRIQKQEKVGQNKQYAAEVLAILLQASATDRAYALANTRKDDIVDILLQLLAPYRKRDPPRDSDEEEYLENIFDSLTCLADETAGKSKFLEAEGVELAIIMLKEAAKFSKPRALRLLDHAAGGISSPEAAAICEKIVDAAGLKPLFQAFSKALRESNHNGGGAAERRQDAEHILGILASMLRLLPGDSGPRIRLLLKFVEGEGSKTHQHLVSLVKLRHDFQQRLQPVEQVIAAERAAFDKAGDGTTQERATMEDQWLERRLDAGLFTLQTVDVVLAWLAAEDGGANAKIAALLKEENLSLGDVRATLQEQLRDLEREGDDEETANDDSKDMLKTLMDCLG